MEEAETYLEVGVARENNVFFLVRTLDHYSDQVLQARFNFLDLTKQPKAHVCRDLVIARAASVKFTTERADDLAQSAFISGVNVFVVLLDLELCTGMSGGRNGVGKSANLVFGPLLTYLL